MTRAAERFACHCVLLCSINNSTQRGEPRDDVLEETLARRTFHKVIDPKQFPLFDGDAVVARRKRSRLHRHVESRRIRRKWFTVPFSNDVGTPHRLTERLERLIRRRERDASSVDASFNRHRVVVGAVHREHGRSRASRRAASSASANVPPAIETTPRNTSGRSHARRVAMNPPVATPTTYTRSSSMLNVFFAAATTSST